MILHAAAFCAALAVAPPPTAACSCMGPNATADALTRAQAAFVGTPVRQRTFVAPDGRHRRIYTFTATRWLKGGSGRTAEVETGMGGGDCGVTFPLGRRATVYADFWDAGRLTTSYCGLMPALFPPRRRHSR